MQEEMLCYKVDEDAQEQVRCLVKGDKDWNKANKLQQPKVYVAE